MALKFVNKIPESERIDESSSNGNFIKPHFEPADENVENRQNKKMASLVDNPNKRDGYENSGEGVANSEVEYIESEKLEDVEDVENCLKVFLM